VLEANVRVPVDLAARLTQETSIELIDAGGKPLTQGKVSFVAPEVGADTQSVLVKTVVQDPRLRPDQLLRARVVWGSHPGLRVPAPAVVRRSGQTFLYVAESKDGHLVAGQRSVRLGDVTSQGYEVLEGLKAGEQVIVSGVQKVTNGALLQPES
jgi:multidrug efflux pump subunit AcrA (membrane-fusion protein)